MGRYNTLPVPSVQQKNSLCFRAILPCAVAGAALVALLTTPMRDPPLCFTTTAYAATGQGPYGFADLANRVKGAVVSVRVKIDKTGKVSSGLPFRPGSPLYKFFFPNGSNHSR